MDSLFTSLFTVALAEIGDKTQLLSLVLASRFKKPWPIIAGILLATLANHGLSAWAGSWLRRFIEGSYSLWIIGGSFVAVGLWLLIPDKDDDETPRLQQYGAFVVSLTLFFLAEIGDKTQIATVLLGARFDDVLLVTFGTTAGMLIANVPVVFAGNALMARLPMRTAHLAAAAVFILIGLYTMFF
ncbi:MAG: TMEM165/GDT1 family protein [Alphaproteobacteria bacterium]|nr:MAG: TMEM165/GDT1 family protein [Alphaproteobacteria bacterium]